MSSRLMIFSLQKGHVPLPQLRRKGSSICVSEVFCSPSLTHKLINQGRWLAIEKGPLKWMFCGYILQIRKSFKDHCGKNEDVAVSENESVFFRIGGNTMIILTSNLRSFVVGTLQWCFHWFLCQQKTNQKESQKNIIQTCPSFQFHTASKDVKKLKNTSNSTRNLLEFVSCHVSDDVVCLMTTPFDKISSALKDEQGRLHDMTLRAAHHARYLAWLFFWAVFLGRKYHGRYEKYWERIITFLVGNPYKPSFVVVVVVSNMFWNFHPETWGRWTHFDEHIFQKGGSTTNQ